MSTVLCRVSLLSSRSAVDWDIQSEIRRVFSFSFLFLLFIWKTDMNIHPFGCTFSPVFSLDWLHLARCLILGVTMWYSSVQSWCGCGVCFCLLSCVACNKRTSRSLVLRFWVYFLLCVCAVIFFVSWGDYCKRDTIIMRVSLWRTSSSAVVCTVILVAFCFVCPVSSRRVLMIVTS